MTTIGNLQETETSGLKEISGQVSTLHLNISFKLLPNTQKSGSNDPSYIIYTQSLNGSDVQIGSAWERTIQKTGEIFLSITLDDHSFDKPLNVAAFQNNPNKWDIVWRRRQISQNKNEAV